MGLERYKPLSLAEKQRRRKARALAAANQLPNSFYHENTVAPEHVQRMSRVYIRKFWEENHVQQPV